MVGGDAVILCKAQNVADGNAADDLGGRKPIDLLGKDMFQPGVIVREDLPHLLAAVKALDDFRNVQAGDRKSTRLNSSHKVQSRMPSSA